MNHLSDNYVDKHRFLPNADFAFLDEIWKSSPAILNTLLTIINEKTYRNGTKIENVPLKVLISASNETPPEKQGLEALYDRFLVRLFVPPMEEKSNFELLLNSTSTTPSIKLPDNIIIKQEEWELWRLEIEEVELSQETLNIIHDIRLKFSEKENDHGVYVSDRRWQRAAILLKSGAFFCGRDKTNLVDTLLLRHCLWTTNENREAVIKAVEDSVRDSGFITEISTDKLDIKKDELEKEITSELYYSNDIYETVRLNDNEYFCAVINGKESTYSNINVTLKMYISIDKMKDSEQFHPVDAQGNEIEYISCNFDKQGTCSIVHDRYGDPKSREIEDQNYTPEVLFHKGDKNTGVNKKLIDALDEEVIVITKNIDKTLKEIESKYNEFKEQIDTPFISDDIRDIALESVTKQIHDMKIRLDDCSRLKSLVTGK